MNSSATLYIKAIIALISKQRLSLTKEKLTQLEIQRVLQANGFLFLREYLLDNHNIPDFFFEMYGVAIEVKIKGQRSAIYKQLKRYCEFDQVKAIILISGRSMGLPGIICGKPAYYINLTRAYL